MSRMVPRGVVVAGLGKRFLAALVDAVPVIVCYAALFLVLQLTASPAVHLVGYVVGGVIVAGYGLYQWWAYATRGAGIGAQAVGVRLVSMADGEPIGWWRFFLRQLVFSALMGTVVGGIALLVFLVIHERRQGWHDMVAGAVLVEPAEVESRPAGPARKVSTPSTVGLPPHLASSFSPQPGTSQGMPEWLPGVQEEPVGPPSQAYPPQAQAGWPQPSPGWQGQSPAPTMGQTGAAPSNQFPPPASPMPPAPAQWQAPQPPNPPQPATPPVPALPETQLPRPIAQSWIPIPTPSSVIEPSRNVRVRQREFGEVPEDEGTRIAPVGSTAGRAGDEGWYLRLDDGREVELNVTVLLGRNPQKQADDPNEVHLVPASGDGRMISRTHVLIGTDPRGVFVMDRGSTNGTALVTQTGELDPCPVGTQKRVQEGQQVSYGNRWFTVLRRPVLG